MSMYCVEARLGKESVLYLENEHNIASIFLGEQAMHLVTVLLF